MLKKFAVMLAALVMALGLGAAPAMAQGQSANDCDDVNPNDIRICLYDSGTYYTPDGFWNRRFASLGYACEALNNHTWHNGGSVNDTAGSVIISAAELFTGQRWRVRFYDWTNCSSANGYFDLYVTGNGWNGYSNLTTVGFNNRIGSVQIFAA